MFDRSRFSSTSTQPFRLCYRSAIVLRALLRPNLRHYSIIVLLNLLSFDLDLHKENQQPYNLKSILRYIPNFINNLENLNLVFLFSLKKFYSISVMVCYSVAFVWPSKFPPSDVKQLSKPTNITKSILVTLRYGSKFSIN